MGDPVRGGRPGPSRRLRLERPSLPDRARTDRGPAASPPGGGRTPSRSGSFHPGPGVGRRPTGRGHRPVWVVDSAGRRPDLRQGAAVPGPGRRSVRGGCHRARGRSSRAVDLESREGPALATRSACPGRDLGLRRRGLGCLPVRRRHAGHLRRFCDDHSPAVGRLLPDWFARGHSGRPAGGSTE